MTALLHMSLMRSGIEGYGLIIKIVFLEIISLEAK